MRIGPLLKILLLLVPCAWVILGGPGFYKMLGVGVILSGLILMQSKGYPRMARLVPVLLCVGLYAALDFINKDVSEIFDIKTLLMTTLYGAQAGLCFAQWNRAESRRSLAFGYALFCLALAAIAVVIVRTAGPDRILQMKGSEIIRNNEEQGLVYLGIFEIQNIIIGVIPFTILALAGSCVVLTRAGVILKAIIGLACVLGLYVNFVVVTRTSFAALACSSVVMVPLLWRKAKAGYGFWLSAILGVAVAGALSYRYLGLEIQLLRDRLAEVGQDSRINTWSEAVHLILRNPLGGGSGSLTTHLWAHNVFLDAGLTNGWAGLLAIVGVYGFVLYRIIEAIRWKSVLSEPFGTMLIAGTIGVMAASMVMPPVVSFLTLLCIVAGYLSGLDRIPAARPVSPVHSDRSATATRRERSLRITDDRRYIRSADA